MAVQFRATARQLREYLDFLHQYNVLSARDLARAQAPGFERAFARTILRGKKPRLAGHEFSVATFRSLQGGGFPGLWVVDRRLEPKRNLTAFVGHRFAAGVTNNLRHNLQMLLRPYGISLLYSDTDLPNTPVFATILRRIEKSNFCIFDDRETEIRPNVFIEMGAAIAFRRPYLYLNFDGKRAVRIDGRPEAITTPSDLAGMLHLSYSSYETLVRDLSLRLPAFLRDRKLAS